MPVHTQKSGKKYIVVDDKGKQYGSHPTRDAAVKQTQAINIAEGLTPLTPKKRSMGSRGLRST